MAEMMMQSEATSEEKINKDAASSILTLIGKLLKSVFKGILNLLKTFVNFFLKLSLASKITFLLIIVIVIGISYFVGYRTGYNNGQNNFEDFVLEETGYHVEDLEEFSQLLEQLKNNLNQN